MICVCAVFMYVSFIHNTVFSRSLFPAEFVVHVAQCVHIEMPLLKRREFKPAKLPPDLRPTEEVFHCKITNEIFRDYE